MLLHRTDIGCYYLSAFILLLGFRRDYCRKLCLDFREILWVGRFLRQVTAGDASPVWPSVTPVGNVVYIFLSTWSCWTFLFFVILCENLFRKWRSFLDWSCDRVVLLSTWNWVRWFSRIKWLASCTLVLPTIWFVVFNEWSFLQFHLSPLVSVSGIQCHDPSPNAQNVAVNNLLDSGRWSGACVDLWSAVLCY